MMGDIRFSSRRGGQGVYIYVFPSFLFFIMSVICLSTDGIFSITVAGGEDWAWGLWVWVWV